MAKKCMAFMLMLVLVLSSAPLALAEDPAEEPDGPYAPKEGYDYYTVTTYTIESMGEDLEVTVSKMEDDKQYNLQFWFFGGPADVYVTIDNNGKYVVTNDSGFFQTDGQAVVEQAEEEGDWQPIWVDSDLEYAPNEEYDFYTFVVYTIEAMGEDLQVTVSKNEGDQEYYLDFFFFGGEAQILVTIDDDGNYNVTNDSGFFQTDGPDVVKLSEKVGIWKSVADYTGEVAE